MRLDAAIAGLGTHGLRRDAEGTATDHAWSAVRAAADDAGLALGQVDGLIVCRSGGATEADLGLELQAELGLEDLKFLEVALCEGASAILAIQTAALLVTAGVATHVACVFGDAPMRPGERASAAFSGVKGPVGLRSLRYGAGLFGAPALYALACRRYMAEYGATEEDLAAVAIAARAWAVRNPSAIFRTPLDRDTYFNARWIAEPLRLYDCANPVNGAAAVIVTTGARAADLRRPPVPVLGMGQAHNRAAMKSFAVADLLRPAELAAARMFASAGLTPADVDVLQCYDAFSFLTLMSLEAYGFCPPGQAGAMVRDGGIGPGGAFPVNTGGGHLSGFYLQGMTPVVEAVIQARGDGGERQVPGIRTVMAGNNGGILDYHATLLLGAAGARP